MSNAQKLIKAGSALFIILNIAQENYSNIEYKDFDNPCQGIGILFTECSNKRRKIVIISVKYAWF